MTYEEIQDIPHSGTRLKHEPIPNRPCEDCEHFERVRYKCGTSRVRCNVACVDWNMFKPKQRADR